MRESEDLPALLGAAQAASPNDRIKFRDAIAAHGTQVIEEMRRWLEAGTHQAFAVRVIGRAGILGAKKEAIAALRAVRPAVGETIRGDIDEQLGLLGHQPVAAKVASTPADPYAVASIPVAAGSKWPGFQEHEFGRVAQTVWRSHDGAASLAPLVTRRLRELHPHFDSYGVSRSPQLHFALPERYHQRDEQTSRWRAAKLVIYANGPTDDEPDVAAELVAGLYFERPGKGDEDKYGRLDDRWDWLWLLRALGDEGIAEQLTGVMARHHLNLGDYGGQGFSSFPEGCIGGLGKVEGGEVVFHLANQETLRGWSAIRAYIEGLPQDTWKNLHLWRSWPKDHVLQARVPFLDAELMPVLLDLARLYLLIVHDALPPTSRLPLARRA